MLKSLPLLLVCLGLGMLLRWRGGLPKETTHVLNRVILWVALPALSLRSVHALSSLEPRLWLAAGMLWLVFVGAVGFFALFSRAFAAPTRGALVLTAGLANTAFLGLPMLRGMYGEAAMGPAVIVDQLGSFLVVATLGMAVALRASGKALTPAMLARRVLLFPPFSALVLGLVTRPVAYPSWLLEVLTRLGDMLTPLALLVVGFGLELRGLRGRGFALGLGLFYRLLLAPAVILGVFTLFGGRGLLREVVVLQAAMAPMVTGAILASEHDLDPPLASAMLGVGVPLSLVTVPGWAWVMERVL